MNRNDLLEFDHDATRRAVTAEYELRASTSDPNIVEWVGHSFTTGQPYTVFGGPPYGWVETMARGASKKTLSEGADVAFLVNHEGMTLARTKSGTMDIREDDRGQRVVARLDRRMSAVRDLEIASQRGDMNEMSFGFIATRDAWFDDEGRPSNSQVGTHRTILEIDQNKGDVSAVNYGANPNTSGGVRAAELALAELRNGRRLSERQREAIKAIAVKLDGEDRAPTMSTSMAECIDTMTNCLAQMREYLATDMDDPNADPLNGQLNAGALDGEERAKYDAAQLKTMAGNGHAMPDGSYPIEDAEDLANAIHAVGRGGSSHDAIRKHIMARAKAMGMSDQIPDNWNADGSLKAANAVTLGPSTEALAAMRALHELRRQPAA